jgi:hypothetical protein
MIGSACASVLLAAEAEGRKPSWSFAQGHVFNLFSADLLRQKRWLLIA